VKRKGFKQDYLLDTGRLKRDYLPEPTLSDLGLKVTVCIAAIANDKSVVTASDTKVSIGFSSSDANTVKYEEFHENWIAMMAGNDICHFIPIRDRASDNMRGKPNTLQSAVSAFKDAYQDYLSEVTADRVLRKYQLSVASFKRQGRRYFKKGLYQSLADRVEAVELECTFMVYGFDAKKHPHIFAVRHPGTVDVWDKPGFWAIGSVKTSALGMLLHLNQNIDVPLFRTMYNVLAAKFFSERASDVGRHTVFYVKRYGFDGFARPSNFEAEMRAAWENDGAPRMPDSVQRLFQQTQDKISFWDSKKGRNQRVREFFKGMEKPKL
jgi:20S proteasome alpha/beta subunit